MVASHELVDTVMAAIVGAAGLASCLGAARAGKRLLLTGMHLLEEHASSLGVPE